MKTISICNLKGGVGKTVTSIQLGAALASSGKRVLLIDCDLQHGLTSYFKLPSSGVTLERVLLDGAPLADGVQNVRDNLDIVAASSRMEIADKELPHQPGGDLRLRAALQKLDGYDFVFLDCPSGWGAVVRNALLATDGLILPINCEPAALRSAAETQAKARELGGYFGRDITTLGVLLTCLRLSKIAQSVVKNTISTWPQGTFKTQIRRGERVNELSAFGQTLFDTTSTRNLGLRDDYESLASEVIARCSPTKKLRKAK